MSRPRLAAPKKGENFELRADLNSQYKDTRKEAIKMTIASMTVGKVSSLLDAVPYREGCTHLLHNAADQDVSGLFPDVLKNMQTDDLEQKKLVYLYLMNYAKTQPELVILAVNTFVKVRSSLVPPVVDGHFGASANVSLPPPSGYG